MQNLLNLIFYHYIIIRIHTIFLADSSLCQNGKQVEIITKMIFELCYIEAIFFYDHYLLRHFSITRCLARVILAL